MTWSVDLACDVTSLLPRRVVRLGALTVSAEAVRVEYTITPGTPDPATTASDWAVRVEFEDDAGTHYSPVHGGVTPGDPARGDDASEPPLPGATVLLVHVGPPRPHGSRPPVVTAYVDLRDRRTGGERAARWRVERAARISAFVRALAAAGPVPYADVAERFALPYGHAETWVRHLLAAGALTGAAPGLTVTDPAAWA